MVRCAAVVRGEAAGGGICRPAVQEAPRAGRIPGGSQERSVVFIPNCKVTHQLSFGCLCLFVQFLATWGHQSEMCSDVKHC